MEIGRYCNSLRKQILKCAMLSPGLLKFNMATSPAAICRLEKNIACVFVITIASPLSRIVAQVMSHSNTTISITATVGQPGIVSVLF